MNAYELADELLRDNTQLTVKTAYMLRQQADHIAELSKNVDELEEELLKATHPNAEPVALTHADIIGILQDANSVPLGQPIFNSSEEYSKLKAIIESTIRYVHPAKTLTDAEIIELFSDTRFDAEERIQFARAILRKAQEK